MNWVGLPTGGGFHPPLSDDLSAPHEQHRALFAIGTGHSGAGGGSKGSRRGPRFSAVRMARGRLSTRPATKCDGPN